MKFIITENKFKHAVHTYLNLTLETLEYSGNYYFPYKDTDKLVIKCLDERDDKKLRVIVSSHIIDDVKSIFTIKDTQTMEYIWEWVENKTNSSIIEMKRTPYVQELPSFIRG